MAVALICAAAALLIVFPAPASATHASVDWDDPASGSVLSDTRTIGFDITAVNWVQNGRVELWTLEVLGPDGASLGALCSENYGATGDDAVRVDLRWDTRYSPAVSDPSGVCDDNTTPNPPDPMPALPERPDRYSVNGEHTLKVTITSTLAGVPPAHHTEIFTRGIKVSNPAEAPTQLKASWDPEKERVFLTWSPSPETDVTGYAVDQCPKQTCSSADWSRVANPVGRMNAGAAVMVEANGTYRYRVAAKRPAHDGAQLLSPATQSDAFTAGSDAAPTTGPGGDDPSSSPGGSGGTGGGGNGSDGNGSSGGAGGGNGSAPTSGAGGTGERDRGDLPDRHIDRPAEVDAGYKEALPFGAKPLDGGGGPLEIATRGVGLALVPIAGGALLFVFALQMRYLSRRADALALAAEAPPDGTSPPDDELVPLFRLGAGGSFISNWKRLLQD